MIEPQDLPDGCDILRLPPRPPDAIGGGEFLAATKRLSRPDREAAIHAAVRSGNVPNFLRSFRAVVIAAPVDDGQIRSAVVYVSPDYVAIGSDSDFVRVPMALPTARAIAWESGCSLPTKKLVDLIWAQATVKLSPQSMSPGAEMMSNSYYLEHNRRIELQRAGRPVDELTAGNKKDLVLTNRLRWMPGRVAIYGWHLPTGVPIQTLSTKHGSAYADYSHGVRLVGSSMLVDRTPAAFADVLRDELLSGLVSDEGPIDLAALPWAHSWGGR